MRQTVAKQLAREAMERMGVPGHLFGVEIIPARVKVSFIDGAVKRDVVMPLAKLSEEDIGRRLEILGTIAEGQSDLEAVP